MNNANVESKRQKRIKAIALTKNGDIVAISAISKRLWRDNREYVLCLDCNNAWFYLERKDILLTLLPSCLRLAIYMEGSTYLDYY